MVTVDTFQCLKNVLTIGFFDGHAFLIKDIERLAKTFLCVHCKARFTQACNLQRHAETCARGETRIICPAKKSETPQTGYEKVFYPDKNPSRLAARLVKQEAVKKKFTFTTPFACKVVKGGSTKCQSTGTTTPPKRSFHFTAVSDTGDLTVFLTDMLPLPFQTKKRPSKRSFRPRTSAHKN